MQYNTLAERLDSSLILPLPKKGNLKICKNDRAISLISRLSKAMVRILLNRIKQRQEKAFMKYRLVFGLKEHLPVFSGLSAFSATTIPTYNKKGNSKSQASSYLPISLTICKGKTLERIVHPEPPQNGSHPFFYYNQWVHFSIV